MCGNPDMFPMDKNGFFGIVTVQDPGGKPETELQKSDGFKKNELDWDFPRGIDVNKRTVTTHSYSLL